MGQISLKTGNHLKELRAKKTSKSEISEFLGWARNVSLVWAGIRSRQGKEGGDFNNRRSWQEK